VATLIAVMCGYVGWQATIVQFQVKNSFAQSVGFRSKWTSE